MSSWKDLHKDFTPKLQKRWESFGFIYEQVKEWIEDYDFSPYDVDFAVYNGDEEFIISDMTKEEVNNLREEHNKAVKNKKITLPFEEESKEEEEEIITSSERNWRNIHPDFTPELVQRWQECSFSHGEARDWINIGIGITDAEFCAWLRDVKKVNAEEVLNYGNIEQLQREHQQYFLLIIQQIQAN